MVSFLSFSVNQFIFSYNIDPFGNARVMDCAVKFLPLLPGIKMSLSIGLRTKFIK